MVVHSPTTVVNPAFNIAIPTPGGRTVSISSNGTPAIGVHFGVDVGGSGSVFGILTGMPMNLSIPGCAGCVLGVSGNAYTTNSMAFDIPCSHALIGGIVSFRGFAVGGGNCIASIGLSDTLDVTSR